MEYTFKIRHGKYRNVFRVYNEDTMAGILALEYEQETGDAMVHLLYAHPGVPTSDVRRIWEHLTLHIGKSKYIAYISHRPDMQKLAEQVGFVRTGDRWIYDTNT